MTVTAPPPRMPVARALDLAIAALTLIACRLDALRDFSGTPARRIAFGALAHDARDARGVLRKHRAADYAGEPGGFSQAEIDAMADRVGTRKLDSNAAMLRAARRCASAAEGLHAFALAAAERADEDASGALRTIAAASLELASGLRRALIAR